LVLNGKSIQMEDWLLWRLVAMNAIVRQECIDTPIIMLVISLLVPWVNFVSYTNVRLLLGWPAVCLQCVFGSSEGVRKRGSKEKEGR
jgi:hypothetical protein